MRKIIVLAALMAASSLNAFAELPSSVQTSIEKAYATGDSFVINATLAAAKAQHANDIAAIDATLEALKNPPAPVIEEAPQNWLTSWNGEIGAGFVFSNGNTHKREIDANLKLERDGEKWRNKIAIDADVTTENGLRTEEDYRFGTRLDRKLDETRFLFAEAEYVNDTFSGFNYRITEDVGYGQTFKLNNSVSLEATGGLGARHTETTAGVTKTEMIVKPAANFSWNIREGLDFGQSLSAIMGSERTVTNATTSLKSKLINNFFLKAAFDVEHVSDVPVGTKELDTKTSLNLVYDF